MDYAYVPLSRFSRNADDDKIPVLAEVSGPIHSHRRVHDTDPRTRLSRSQQRSFTNDDDVPAGNPFRQSDGKPRTMSETQFYKEHPAKAQMSFNEYVKTAEALD